MGQHVRTGLNNESNLFLDITLKQRVLCQGVCFRPVCMWARDYMGGVLSYQIFMLIDIEGHKKFFH